MARLATERHGPGSGETGGRARDATAAWLLVKTLPGERECEFWFLVFLPDLEMARLEDQFKRERVADLIIPVEIIVPDIDLA